MIIEVRNLIKRYNDFLALDHISFSIREGEIFGLLGPNGAGKSTTISILSGLTGFDGGEVLFLGKKIGRNEMDSKRELGIVPQDIALFEDLTAQENLDYFGRLYGLKGKLLKDRVKEALAFTGLTERRKDRPKGFSGGMKRRLNIACAILHHPKLIIMDEPTVGIDPQSRNHIMQSIKELNRMGSTIIYTSHYMEEVEEICTKVAVVDRGRVIAQGTKEDLKSLVSSEEKIMVELSTVNFTMVEGIKKIESISECVVNGNRLDVVGKKGEKNVSRIIQVISESEADILSLNVEKPSLEAVFLTLTGRSLRD
ncbi:ABC-2 type transport system ATP-binding protein [Paenibacillus catalpae]|uniref:ABC-2 type transport system ATP-binding protein n=1 Tax=Paenibacillus catalpae TaxID=1045775 RepID=A0A1I2C5Q1_9BACL|nr:ABC transporter ATP-binding protein [Paenibacillus catalpae]SFE63143.1 ABC-2 type transport system ATP-binding protein [Paenibacillus catalpae]